MKAEEAHTSLCKNSHKGDIRRVRTFCLADLKAKDNSLSINLKGNIKLEKISGTKKFFNLSHNKTNGWKSTAKQLKLEIRQKCNNEGE